jgi:hypothetical protein
MSTFSTKGGLYEKAQKKFKLSDGKMLFTYTFFDKRRLEAQVCRPAPPRSSSPPVLRVARDTAHLIAYVCTFMTVYEVHA